MIVPKHHFKCDLNTALEHIHSNIILPLFPSASRRKLCKHFPSLPWMLHVTASNSGGKLSLKKCLRDLPKKTLGEVNIKPKVPRSLTLGTRWRELSSAKIPVCPFVVLRANEVTGSGVQSAARGKSQCIQIKDTTNPSQIEVKVKFTLE